MFDLTIFPLSLEAGREQYELPGLLVSAAPRKAARMRAQDHLVMYCRLVTTAAGGSKTAALTPAQQQEILEHLAETYFHFSGSVTAGLRAVATRLNQFLLNRNLKAANEGQTTGMLNLAAVHGGHLIVAHAGMTHSFVLAKGGVQHFDESAVPGAARGLGLSRQPALRFYHAPVESGDLLLLCPEPPVSWNARSFENSPQLTFEYIRRRLLSGAGVDLQSAVIRFQTGKGQITFWRPGDGAAAGTERASRPLSGQGAALRKKPAEAAAGSPTGATLSAAERSVLNGGTGAPPPPAERVEADFTAFTTPAARSPEAGPVDRAFEAPRAAEGAVGEAAGAGRVESRASATDLRTGDGAPAVEAPAAGAAIYPPLGDDLPLPSGELPSVEELLSGGYTALESAGGRGASAAHPTDDLATRYPNLGAAGHNGKAGIYLGGGSKAGDANPPEPRPGREPAPEVEGEAAPRATGARPGRPARKARPGGPSPLEHFRRSLAALWRGGSQARARTGGVLSKASGALPRRHDSAGREVPYFNLSSGMMLMVALLAPLLVVTVATTVYFRAGRSEQFKLILLQAQQYAQQAGAQTDPAQQRKVWDHVYELVHTAEKYGSSPESQALRQQALSHLDELQNFVRLDYQPVGANTFPAKTNFTRMATTLNDVYLLDADTGGIFRLFRTAEGYEVDPKFTCGPGQAGSANIGPLIDLAPLAPNNEMKSTVMGIDANGNLAYCAPNTTGFEVRPLALPDAGWGKIAGISLTNDTLYVLDPSANAVFRYDGVGAVFKNPPHFYFGDQIPQMQDVIDIASDQEFLYLLHDSGQMTLCDSGGFAYAATKCTDPAPYGDSRAGFEPAPLSFSDSHFLQVVTTQPPDPSLYALDDNNKSIYHLSLRRLNLQRQYRPQINADFPLPGSRPTAFTIAPNRRALLAFGNQVFFAALP